MLRKCADQTDLMSEHFYCGENPKDLVAHVRVIPDTIRRIAAAHRDYRKRLDSLKGKDIRIAMDEWNYWYGPDLYGEIGTAYHLKDALGVAAGLLRSPSRRAPTEAISAARTMKMNPSTTLLSDSAMPSSVMACC